MRGSLGESVPGYRGVVEIIPFALPITMMIIPSSRILYKPMSHD
jgi:hypothetical protein